MTVELIGANMHFLFRHPGLPDRLWRLRARDEEHARARFEDVWMAWAHAGCLEHAEGDLSFFDGTVVEDTHANRNGLVPVVPCGFDLGGHFWVPDERPERLEHVPAYLKFSKKPEVCVLCQETRWA